MMMNKIEAIWLPEVQQQVFRGLMEVMSRPGKIINLAVLSDNASPARALLATLLDAEVNLCDHHALLDESDWPLLQTEKVAVEHARYILCRGESTIDFEPMLGELSSPEHSATIVLVVENLSEGSNHLSLRGPGVKSEISVKIAGLNRDWLTQREQWISSFPLGVDLLLVDDSQLMALPRTTKIEVTSWDM
jgi:alpha-D-ribose 1-methylphosphonate 5-triphosphate synthase subunit PhnH